MQPISENKRNAILLGQLNEASMSLEQASARWRELYVEILQVIPEGHIKDTLTSVAKSLENTLQLVTNTQYVIRGGDSDKLQTDRFDVEALALDLTSALKPLTTLNNTEIKFTRSTYGTMANTQRQALYHALNNTVSNAISYSLPGSTIDLSLQITETSDGRQLEWCIQNHPDIEYRRRIDEITLGKNREPSYRKGTGYGLRIAQRAIRKIGGQTETQILTDGRVSVSLNHPLYFDAKQSNQVDTSDELGSNTEIMLAIFHDARNMFSSAVVGLDELRSYPQLAGYRSELTDLYAHMTARNYAYTGLLTWLTIVTNVYTPLPRKYTVDTLFSTGYAPLLPLCSHAGVDLRLQLDGEQSFEIDPGPLREAIMRLALNSISLDSERSRTLRLGIEVQEAETAQLAVTLELPNEPSHADEETIALGLVQAYQTDVHRFAPGKYRMSIPIQLFEEQATVSSEKSRFNMPRNKVRLLIVEDQDNVRAALVNHFESLGVLTSSCSSAIDAIATLNSEHQPHLILLDIHLGGHTGDVVAHENDRLGQPAAVVVLSADATFYADLKPIISDYLLKPANIVQIQLALAQFAPALSLNFDAAS